MKNNVSIQSVVGLVVRHTIGAVSGGLVTSGVVTGDQVETVAGAVTIVVVAVWSYLQKRNAR